MNKITFAILSSVLLLTACNPGFKMENDHLRIEFSEKGISSVTCLDNNYKLPLTEDKFILMIDGDSIISENLTKPKVTVKDNTHTELYDYGDYRIEVVYELRPGWEFISKQIFISNTVKEAFTVGFVEPFIIAYDREFSEIIDLTGGRYGKIMHDGPQQASSFFLIQNPYSEYEFNESTLSGKYNADFNWDMTSGPFPSDRACLGIYELSGNSYRHDLLPEWSYIQDPDTYVNEGIQIDYADIEAVTNCARAFLMLDPEKSTKVHIGWCENDYQIDVATSEGRKEYLRIIDQAAAVGCDNVLYTPDHSKYGPLENNRDAWGWENLLWLGLGQKVRSGEWVPGKDPIPADIQQMLDYADNKGVKLMAYVYPSLPFMQDSSWTAWRTSIGQKPEHYLTVDTGLRSFQDWFIDLCIAFYEQTGISGYSFDHWWIAYEDEKGLVSSKYQQWFGTRRILEELRRRAPEIIIDGRQQYHHFGTFTWLAGTYPHPMMSDEQPGSFNPFTDLSTDRISADRQRYVAHRLMVRDFTPIEILPGFITHQTQRSDAERVMRRDSYRTKDWDYLGWKYSIISTIATAPFNLVVNYLPARDTAEFNNFSDEDKAFFNHWLDFADENLEVLENLRPVIGQPMAGRCDGTSAIKDDHGFIFLFNPNYRQLPAEFKLDESIGLTSGDKFILREVYPLQAVNIAHPQNGFFTYGDLVSINMTGTSALVIEVVPMVPDFGSSLLFNSPGEVVTNGNTLEINDVKGVTGSRKTIMVYHPRAESIQNLTVNGIEQEFKNQDNIIKADMQFEGAEFRKAEQIGQASDEKVQKHVFTIPQSIMDQLSLRRKAWPVQYSEDDLRAPWAGPSRLLLFINIADPYREVQEAWNDGGQARRVPINASEISIEINGEKLPVLEAYNGIYPYVTRTFLGFYADVSHLKTDTQHTLRLTLPGDLKPGQFQGIFFENVEDEFTGQIRQKAEGKRQK